MKVDNLFMVFNTKDDPVLKHSQKMQKIFNQKTTTYEVIEAEEKEKVSIGMVAYNKWKEANSDNKS